MKQLNSLQSAQTGEAKGQLHKMILNQAKLSTCQEANTLGSGWMYLESTPSGKRTFWLCVLSNLRGHVCRELRLCCEIGHLMQFAEEGCLRDTVT